VSEAKRLQELEKRLADLVAEADRLAEDPILVGSPPWKPLFDKLRNQTRSALAKARSPVKIGVVGEFGASKSLLLSGLIGYANALPVEEIATAGNVTALRFTPTGGISSTEMGPYSIAFLSHAGFIECLRFMLKEAARRAKASNLPEDLRTGLNAIYPEDDQALSRIDNWCLTAWGRTANPSLKYSIRELVVFVRAYMRYGTGLCDGGDPLRVDHETALQGLQFEPSPNNIQTLPFADIPTPTRSLSSRPSGLTAQQLREAFPLIRLVTIGVKLARGIWDFAGLGAERFVLLDFPGLGADSSGVRDLFLCLCELRDIQTLLILLNGKKPAGDQGPKIQSLLQEHREGQDISDMILVDVGRFDQAPLPVTELRKLAGTRSGAGRRVDPMADEGDEEPTAGAQWLADFAEDGGVARLRRLLVSHVQAAGFALLLKDVVCEVEAVLTAQQELRQALPAPAAGPNSRTAEDQFVAAEMRFGELREIYREQVRRLEKTRRLALTRNGFTRQLEDLLHEEVVFRVYDWPQWETLFQSIQNNQSGFITERTRGTSLPSILPTEEDENGSADDGSLFPTSSEDFFGSFEETVNKLSAFTRELIDRSLFEYLAALVPEVEPARLTLGDSLARKSLVKEIAALKQGETTRDLVVALRVAINPARLRLGLYRPVSPGPDAPEESPADLPLTPLVPSAIFPLARATNQTPGCVFGWAACFRDAPENARPEATLTHAAMVLRLRDEFVRILRREMSQQLNEGIRLVLDPLIERLKLMVQKLGLAANNRSILETIVTQKPVEEALAAYRRLASAKLF
jgi:hypothetical protein